MTVVVYIWHNGEAKRPGWRISSEVLPNTFGINIHFIDMTCTFLDRIFRRVQDIASRSSNALLIERNHLNLHPHIILAQSRHPHGRPDRLMIRHPLCKVSLHGCQSLVVQRDMVRIDSENLRPAFSSRISEVQIDVRESLVDLCVDFGVVDSRLGIPTSWSNQS